MDGKGMIVVGQDRTRYDDMYKGIKKRGDELHTTEPIPSHPHSKPHLTSRPAHHTPKPTSRHTYTINQRIT
ncbi:hypothetical protein EJ04DRAFT_516945 [Polyplosphaeria fusca]|uniref:Uncharacterized protein n=1 Tax=Polyplosphaeria fusca TaxID=682080 RepID=A0A9P4UTL2_9PLEO|nr:hypothetical protein EJ04DRAFT_516945 [Polyplosphaeria fusca]